MKTSDQNFTQNEWGIFFPFREGKYIMDIRSDQVFKAVFTKNTYE
jgi:hypothetical protein